MKQIFQSVLRLGTFMLVACGSPQKPASFATATAPEAAFETVSRTLAAEGQPAALLDRSANIVQTEWKDTGFMFGTVNALATRGPNPGVNILNNTGLVRFTSLSVGSLGRHRCPYGPPERMLHRTEPAMAGAALATLV